MTIAAISTPRGIGGIAIVRVSGPDARRILERCFHPKSGAILPGRLQYGFVSGDAGERLDDCMAVFFPAPKTYTREDICEIQCHGGVLTAERCLKRVLAAGARPAQPGEFTKRAFLNGRIDLSQAEAVMSFISAGGEAASRSALRALEGGVSAKVSRWKEALTGILSMTEAAMDFPEEMDEEKDASQLKSEIRSLLSSVEQESNEERFRLLRDGLTVALIGKPNTGKSSLMNAILGCERAIVTEYPGTTRDLLRESFQVNGIPITLVDTAGQRETENAVERIGVNLARKAEKEADIKVLVVDGSEELSREDRELLDRADQRTILVINKEDLPQKIEIPQNHRVPSIVVSARTGEGVEELLGRFTEMAGKLQLQEAVLTTERQIFLAKKAAESLKQALSSLEQGLSADVIGIDLMDALNSLCEITGENAREEVIDRVFRDFCVGK
ncbi:MAG: tRNA uridine-5-carboxymethylaminomethyl(34) synthesis GTPase MnmE [Clostridia bacterium]|nr:tRNA uridine-5-carboxymethylaminomethyl(34) synthesis GTPase MnmE [Clostridia bacterium]